MEELLISIKSSLEELKDSVDGFAIYNRSDKRVLYDIYISEFTQLVTYLEEIPLPSIFNRNELKLLLNKIDDEVNGLKIILSCYSDLEEKKHRLDTEFDIVEKSTILYHHLGDLVHTMEMYLGFDQTDKFRSLEVMFDQVVENMKAQKKKKFHLFQNELLELKSHIQETEFDEKAKLIKEIDGLLNELNVSEIFNHRKAFIIKQELEDLKRLSRKRSLRRDILIGVQLRLLGSDDPKIANNLESFDLELEKIKESVKDQSVE